MGTKKENTVKTPAISREVTATLVRTNRIIIDFSSSKVEVESFSEPLDKVFAIANTIAMALGRGRVDGKDIEDRLEDVGVR